MKAIRSGQRRNQGLPTMTQKDLDCLTGFWSLEEQLGLRKKPYDTFMQQIPPITLDRPVSPPAAPLTPKGEHRNE